MTDEDVEKLSIAIARALQQARSVSDSEHFDHHIWISARIERERVQRAYWEAMLQHVMKWGAVSVISSGGYALYLGMRQIMKMT